MSTEERDKLFNAYLDGQLSAAESARFDESLSPEERARVAAEIKLESAMGGLFGADTPCPDAVWRRTQLLINNQSTGRARRFSPWARVMVGAVAAMALFIVGSFLLNQSVYQDDLFTVSAATVGELEATAEVRGDHDALCAHMRSLGFDVTLDTVENVSAHTEHELRLLGMCCGHCQGEEVLQILLDCCGYPTKIIVAPVGSAAAKKIVEMKAKGVVQETRTVGEFIACVLGSHPSHDALDFLKEK